MTEDKNDPKTKKDEKNSSSLKPEPETLHTTDPQEHMEGPISSLMRKAGESFDSEKTKEEADKEKEKDK